MATANCVLVVAGLDPSGGAGLLADIESVRAHGLRAVGVASALTVQDSARCHAFEAVDPDLLRRQLEVLVDDLSGSIKAIKVGMVGDGMVARVVARALAPLLDRGVPLVFDPVLRASVGADLFVGDPEEELGPLLAVTHLLTPNRAEAEALTGLVIEDAGEQRRAARALRAQGPRAVLVKGGHIAVAGAPPSPEVTDLLDDGDGDPLLLSGRRIAGPTPHGTGCALSSAIAARLALGATLRDAVKSARDHLSRRIAAAVVMGGGRPSLGTVAVEAPPAAAATG